jgi:multidrug efflux pump subunit AcrA (membrane-fusion protein)
MMPAFKSDKPGKSPMGMDMVPVYEGEEPHAAEPGVVTVQPGLVEHGPVRREFRTLGTVAYNEEGLRDITTKYEGWIEKLHVNATWATVKAGDPLFDIYSPDLYNAQLNFLVASRTEKDGQLTQAARERMKLFDLPDEFIAELSKRSEPQRTFTFRAPVDGVVIEKMAVVGQMMKPGERIYRLADLSTVWVNAQIYEKDFPFVSEEQAVSVHTSYGPERKFEGKVRLLLPQVEEQTRTATARIVLPNIGGFLRPGMFVEVGFTAQLAADAVLVPDVAVLRSGERNTVFVALDGGYFEPREVKLGARSEGNFYQVLSGLKAGERIVTSGQFMLDSESQLREAIQKMLRNAAASSAETAAQAAAPATHQHGSATTAPTSNMTSAADVSTLLRPIALAAADAAASLAADDLDGYRRQLSVLRDALTSYFKGYAHAAHGPLGRYTDGLPAPDDLVAARKQFEPFSTTIADLAREARLHETAKLHIFECPMAPETGKARWLQRDAGTKNPFFGTEMPKCGDEIAGPAAPTKPSAFVLPPGHPPLDAATMASFTNKPAAPMGEESCGSCGMSKAAMAAGEPCKM